MKRKDFKKPEDLLKKEGDRGPKFKSQGIKTTDILTVFIIILFLIILTGAIVCVPIANLETDGVEGYCIYRSFPLVSFSEACEPGLVIVFTEDMDELNELKKIDMRDPGIKIVEDLSSLEYAIAHNQKAIILGKELKDGGEIEEMYNSGYRYILTDSCIKIGSEWEEKFIIEIAPKSDSDLGEGVLARYKNLNYELLKKFSECEDCLLIVEDVKIPTVNVLIQQFGTDRIFLVTEDPSTLCRELVDEGYDYGQIEHMLSGNMLNRLKEILG